MEKYRKIWEKQCDEYSVYYGKGIYDARTFARQLHYDIDVTITYFKHCTGNIRVDGKCYPLYDGDVIITNPAEMHCCTFEDESLLERISFFVSKSLLKNFTIDIEELFDCFYNRENGAGNRTPAHIAEKYALESLTKEILALSHSNEKCQHLLILCRFIELLMRLNDAASQEINLPPNTTGENEVIVQVIQYINQHFTENINCEDIAKEFYLSRSRLEHLFKDSVGFSLWDYIIFKRLMMVNTLIQQGESVKAASSNAGFNNYSNFYRLYKKHMNMTPLEYKKQL